jgi:hypothetical protein
VPTAACHFLHPGRAGEQADRFVHEVDRLSGWGGVGVTMDVERTGRGTNPQRDDVVEFLAELRRLLGRARTELLYTGRWYWVGVLGNPDMTDLGVALVESRYVPGTTPAPWRDLARALSATWFADARCGGLRPTIVQYAGTRGLVDGIATPCDLDAYQGTAGELRALLLGTPTPEHRDEDDMVIVSAPGRPWLAYYPASGAARVIGPGEQDALRAVHKAAGDPARSVQLSAKDYDLLVRHLDRGVRGQIPGLAQIAGQVAGLTSAVTRLAAGSGADPAALAAAVQAAERARRPRCTRPSRRARTRRR